MSRARLVTLTTLAACLAGLGAAPTQAALSPTGFSPNVDNPWYPLRPGTVLRYSGVKDGKRTTNVVTVTHRTKLVAGVTCVVVNDRLYAAGKLAEDTVDWFAQDRAGTVWYFGEQTREVDRRGRTVSTEGSWEAGVKGARQGVIMPAHPQVGDAFAQEHFPGHAEDHFKVVSLHTSVTVPYGRFRRRAMLTREWTPLEPGVIDHKYYVRGIGEVEEATARGPREFGRLVSISHR
jgi:hypothetical protein